MRATILASFALFAASFSGVAQQIPRPSPDFTIDMGVGKPIKVSDYRGKVLCLVFILTT